MMRYWEDNQPQATEAIKKVLKEDYNYDSTVRDFDNVHPNDPHKQA